MRIFIEDTAATNEIDSARTIFRYNAIARHATRAIPYPRPTNRKPRIFELLSNSLHLDGLVAVLEGLIPPELWISPFELLRDAVPFPKLNKLNFNYLIHL